MTWNVWPTNVNGMYITNPKFRRCNMVQPINCGSGAWFSIVVVLQKQQLIPLGWSISHTKNSKGKQKTIVNNGCWWVYWMVVDLWLIMDITDGWWWLSTAARMFTRFTSVMSFATDPKVFGWSLLAFEPTSKAGNTVRHCYLSTSNFGLRRCHLVPSKYTHSLQVNIYAYVYIHIIDAHTYAYVHKEARWNTQKSFILAQKPSVLKLHHFLSAPYGGFSK